MGSALTRTASTSIKPGGCMQIQNPSLPKSPEPHHGEHRAHGGSIGFLCLHCTLGVQALGYRQAIRPAFCRPHFVTNVTVKKPWGTGTLSISSGEANSTTSLPIKSTITMKSMDIPYPLSIHLRRQRQYDFASRPRRDQLPGLRPGLRRGKPPGEGLRGCQ